MKLKVNMFKLAMALILPLFVIACGSKKDSGSTSSLKAMGGLSGHYEIQQWESFGCLDVEGQGTHNGAKVHMWGCHNQWSQRWNVEEVADGRYMIRHQSGKCLDVSNGDAAQFARIQLWDCAHGHPNQTFWIDRTHGINNDFGYQLVNYKTNQLIAQYNGTVGQWGGQRYGIGGIQWRLNRK